MLAWLRDIRQKLSWKLAYQRAARGLPFKCPWWADKIVFALGDIEGKKARGKK